MVSIVIDEDVIILEVVEVLFRDGDSVLALGSWNETLLVIVAGWDPSNELEVAEVFDRIALCCDMTA